MNDFSLIIPEQSQYPGMEQDMEGIELLVSTIEGTVPGNRYFGMPADLLSSPIEDACNDFLIALIEKVEYYYPNLEVLEVEFASNKTGTGLSGTIYLTRSTDDEEDEDTDDDEEEEEDEDE